MTDAALGTSAAERLSALLQLRTDANRRFFEAEAEQLAHCCQMMAERFAAGGRLIAIGRTPGARSDARHVAVEFVHPVIVGKRALPALGLAGDGGSLVEEVALLTQPGDIVIAFGAEEDGGDSAAGLALARERGCLTIAFDAAASAAEYLFVAPVADVSVRQELVETLYHVLWELVHVFLDHTSRAAGGRGGASSFLYPFLEERGRDLRQVRDDVRASALMKAQEVGALREQTLRDNSSVLIEAAAAIRERFEAGGKLLALGNGGSATDAMDAVADFRAPLRSGDGGSAHGWPAIDLTEDSGILTAIANDIGTEAIFLRQVIAYGAAGDVLLALSTSGNSANVIAALAEGRKRGLLTIAMVGYDGGRVAAEQLADHVVVTCSEHIPRIQEAQASAYHALRELVG